MRGIEPLALAWKAKVLPLYDIRKQTSCCALTIVAQLNQITLN
jgi:hypothetical protein